MQRVLSYLAAPLLLTTAIACSKPAEAPQTMTQDTAPQSTASTKSATPSATAPYDVQFLDSMSAHHTSAIQMATMAQGSIQRPELKKLIANIPGDQQKEIDQMKAWRDQWYAGAAKSESMAMPGMDGGMNMDMSHMQSMKPGKDYDVMFIDMMTPHHDGAVTMAREALTKAEHPEIKTLAQHIIDAQTKEIAQMKAIKDSLKK